MQTAATDADTIQSQHADLEMLAAGLKVCGGLTATVRTVDGTLAYLDVYNAEASVLSEKIYAHADAFWWSWAEKICSRQEVPKAVAALARVLRTVNSQQP
jgi:hypothetical protein